MDLNQLKLNKGKWLVANCGKFPSDKNCQLVIMAPETQRNELLDEMVLHASNCHQHQKSDQLRQELSKIIEPIEVK